MRMRRVHMSSMTARELPLKTYNDSLPRSCLLIHGQCLFSGLAKRMEFKRARWKPLYFWPATLGLLTTAFCFWIVWHSALSRADEAASVTSRSEQRSSKSASFISSTCKCTRNHTGEDLDLERKGSYWDWCSPESSLRGFHQKVVSFSIYGKNDGDGERYFSFIRQVAKRIQKVLPGWIMRVYHNLDTDSEEHQLLCDAYCDYSWMDLCDINVMWKTLSKREKDWRKPDWRPVTGEQISNMNRMMWRLIPMLDPLVDIFISRDMDSNINDRELAALQQWFESKFTFSVMRDHHVHTNKILGGLFGVKNFQRRDLIQGLAKILIHYCQNHHRYGIDQNLLANIVWPIAKHDVMAHDSYNCMEEWNAIPTFPFPTRRENRTFVSDGFVGRWVHPKKCPIACRPLDHHDWDYC